MFVLLLNALAVESQTRRFKHLTSADGISQSEVYSFLEDSRGFIWFGTVDGLNRYDGYDIEIFSTSIDDPHSLSNNTVRSLAEDKFGRIWIGTDNGLNVYDPKTELIYQIKINIVEKRFPVWSLYIQNDYLLVGSAHGLWRTKIEPGDIETIEPEFSEIKDFNSNSNAYSFIRSIVKCKSGGLWIITANNLSRIVFQEGTSDPVVFEDLVFSNFRNQRVAAEDSEGNLWIASTEDGLLRYNPATREADYFNSSVTAGGPSSDKCSSLATDRDGNLWVGTLDKGLNFIKSEDLNNDEIYFETIQNEPFNPNNLNSNLVYSLYVSDDNLLWVGTIGAGVNIYNPEQKKFTHYQFGDLNGELSNSNFVRSVYVDDNNRIWTGTHGNGLFLFNRVENKFHKLGFETQSVFFIHPYKENKKLICCSSGLFLVDLVNRKLKILSSYQNEAVFNVTKGNDGMYWVATLTGLARIEIAGDQIITGTKYTIETDPAISDNNIRVLFYDNNNTLYAGTEGGGLNIISLNKNYYPEEVQVYQKSNDPHSISNNYIRAIIEDSSQTIWIGTYQGLNKLVRDSITGEVSFIRYTKKDGLPNSMIQLIAEDDGGNLWIGTNGGLLKFDPDTERFINFTVEDGLQSNEFSEHTVYKKPDGEIIIGGINGINTFYPEEITVSGLSPETTITGFYLFNEKISALEKIGRKAPLQKGITLVDSISLLPRQKNIGFEFSAMIYPNAEKIKYAYMLEGFDENWNYTEAGNRIASYTNLRHGKYIFKVKSTNSDGVWENSSKEIFVHIKTPFAYTWFAYVIYVLIAILIFVYFSHYTIIRYTTKKKLLLEKNHNEKLHELDLLRTKFFINISHDLRTPITLIRGPLDVLLQNKKLSNDVNEKLQLIKRNVKRLNYLIEQLLDVRKAESGTLTAKLNTEDIVAFTKEEITHFSYAVKQKGLILNVVTDSEKIPAGFDRAMLSKVYFNIISNAIKFTDKGKIEIIIKRVDSSEQEITRNAPFKSYIKVEIRDSGKGISKEQNEKIFDRFYQGKNQSGTGYGIGLSHTKELIDAHRGYIEVRSKEGAGTTIRFFLPNVEDAHSGDVSSAASTEDMYVNAEIPTKTADDEKPLSDTAKTILIVEDNADMRGFIKSQLIKEYNVIEAADGLEGLKQANDHLPDLIVCDVMMPNMDGIEMCDKIKSDIETSHIPLVLLTAKVDLETKYDGIKTGADDYIPKPFEMEYLSIRIKNLLESRERLRQKFQKSNTLEPSAVTVTSVDEKFLTSLMEAINEGISDSDFLVSSLESKMGMSHANFYRKVKSLTGQSGHELLMSMRMKRAYQILSDNKGIRVAEVAYMVGFQNPNYFGRCFKKMYGKSPTEINV